MIIFTDHKIMFIKMITKRNLFIKFRVLINNERSHEDFVKIYVILFNHTLLIKLNIWFINPFIPLFRNLF